MSEKDDRVKTAAEILEERLKKQADEKPLAPAAEALKKAADAAPAGAGPAPGGASAGKEGEGLKKKIAELDDQLLRTRAEFDNFQKRTKREMGEYKDFALVEVMKDVLTAIDTLDMALRAAPAPEGSLRGEPTPQSVAAFKSGVEMVRGQLEKILVDRGATRVTTEGATFDPRQHEAILADERDDVPPGTVTGELRRGYMFKDRVVRAAQVRVSKAPENSPAS
jgi:molecular chaperone GrpE